MATPRCSALSSAPKSGIGSAPMRRRRRTLDAGRRAYAILAHLAPLGRRATTSIEAVLLPMSSTRTAAALSGEKKGRSVSLPAMRTDAVAGGFDRRTSDWSTSRLAETAVQLTYSPHASDAHADGLRRRRGERHPAGRFITG